MKKLCFALTVILVGAIFTIIGFNAEEVGEDMDLFIEPEKVVQTRLTGLCVQFNATSSFSKIDIFIANASVNRNCIVEFKLYKWDENIAKTVNGKPVHCEKRDEFFPRNTYYTWDLSSVMPKKGEYLFVMEKMGGNGFLDVNIMYPEKENVRLYENFSERFGSLKMRINTKGLDKLSDNSIELFDGFDTWVATDGLGREVPSTQISGKVRNDKYVGLFFHTWHTHNHAKGMRNITEILKEHPEIVHDWDSEHWGTGGVFFWNEPIYGYYRTDDRWVLRKQAEMLANAGVDAIFFDNTNNELTFVDEVLVLLEVFAKARLDGVKTPQISFILPIFDYDFVATQLRELYREIYSQGRYKDLWFYWKGKPLIMCYPGKLNPQTDLVDAEIMEFFNFRPPNHSHTWDNVQVRDENGNPLIYGAIQPEIKKNYIIWNWISIYPQLIARNPDGTPEQVTVSVAQNWNAKRGLTAMNGENVYGRHYSVKEGKYDTRKNAKLYGVNFQEQWDYAIEIDPEIIFITGWNEWVAGRFEEWGGVKNAFPDQFSDEYSRDIEPSKGDLKDHYYYQMVSNIRRFKGTKPVPKASGKKTIDIYSDEDMWKDVSPNFFAYKGNTFDRDFNGYVDKKTNKPISYENRTGRNDLVSAKVARDNEFVYFMVECTENIVGEGDKSWMRLFIEIGGRQDANWESFHYVVNRQKTSNGTAVLEKSTGGWNWEEVGLVEYSLKGKRLQIKVPKFMLGIKGDKFVINFKWSDNMQVDGDIMDFYINGDVAPNGRFKYQYATYSYEKSPLTRIATLVLASIVIATVILKNPFMNRRMPEK